MMSDGQTASFLCSLLAPSRGFYSGSPNLEVLVLVPVAVAHMSLQSVCGEETLGAASELASREKYENKSSKCWTK